MTKMYGPKFVETVKKILEEEASLAKAGNSMDEDFEYMKFKMEGTRIIVYMNGPMSLGTTERVFEIEIRQVGGWQ